MKVIQMLPCFTYGDAIGNDTLALDALLKKLGYKTIIFAEAIGNRIPRNIVRNMDQWRVPDPDDVIIYHMAVGWDHIDKITSAPCRKIAIYHNITPAHFYREYNAIAFDACTKGLDQVKSLNHAFDYCLADSEFNKQDLISYGYTCPIDVLPILIPYEDYAQKPNERVVEKYKGKGTNILFVGRVVPNKRHEDIIAAFYLYQKYYNKKARLFLVGSFDDNDRYCRRLKAYIERLGLDNVIIPGHIKFDEILGYFASADAFLCLSEHEGFCVPLVEAMLFKVPIVAYDSCAVGETMKNGGLLLKDKDLLETAGALDRVITDKGLREQIIGNQRERLEDFRTDRIGRMFEQYLKAFLEK